MFHMTTADYKASEPIISALQDVQTAILVGRTQVIQTMHNPTEGGYLVHLSSCPLGETVPRHFLVFFDDRGMSLVEVEEEAAYDGSWCQNEDLELEFYEYEPEEGIPLVFSHIAAAYTCVAQHTDPTLGDENNQSIN